MWYAQSIQIAPNLIDNNKHTMDFQLADVMRSPVMITTILAYEITILAMATLTVPMGEMSL